MKRPRISAIFPVAVIFPHRQIAIIVEIKRDFRVQLVAAPGFDSDLAPIQAAVVIEQLPVNTGFRGGRLHALPNHCIAEPVDDRWLRIILRVAGNGKPVADQSAGRVKKLPGNVNLCKLIAAHPNFPGDQEHVFVGIEGDRRVALIIGGRRDAEFTADWCTAARKEKCKDIVICLQNTGSARQLDIRWK